ncbi:MAG: hypothetical protein ACSHXF_01725 [Aquaticitalea sp.]
MRSILAVGICVLLVGIPTAIIYYVVSIGIIGLFDMETYVGILLTSAFLILIWNVYKYVSKFFRF